MENFKAPQNCCENAQRPTPTGLSKKSGVVLVEFWSVNCGYLREGNVPAANDLADAVARALRSPGLLSPNENDRIEIERFSHGPHPMSALVRSQRFQRLGDLTTPHWE